MVVRPRLHLLHQLGQEQGRVPDRDRRGHLCAAEVLRDRHRAAAAGDGAASGGEEGGGGGAIGVHHRSSM
jgi:hypothetical protein